MNSITMRIIMGMIDITLGVFLTVISVIIYTHADYSELPNMAWFFFGLHLIVLPLGGFALVILGFIRIFRKPTKEEIKE